LRIAGPANQVREVANNFAPDDFGDTSVTEVRWGGRREIVPGFVEQDKYLVVAAPWMGSGMRVIDGILSRAWKDVVLANCLRQGTAPGDLDIRLETRDHEEREPRPSRDAASRRACTSSSPDSIHRPA
jgi:hypothetical protein